MADLIGDATQIIVGPKSLASGKVEIKNRKNGEKSEVSFDEIMLKFLK